MSDQIYSKGYIGSEDLQIGTGTFLRKNHLGSYIERTQVNKSHFGIDWYADARDYVNFATAISELNDLETKVLLIVSSLMDVPQEVTCNSNVYVWFVGEGSLNNTGNITFNSPSHVKAESNQTIFTGSGTISFTNPGIMYPDWWKKNTTPGTTDMYAAIYAAETACSNGGTIKFNEYNTYVISTDLSIGSDIILDLTNAELSIDSAIVLTIYSAACIVAPRNKKIFTGEGNVVFSTADEEVIFNWFETSAKAVYATPIGGSLLLLGTLDFADYGVISSTKPIYIRGIGWGKFSDGKFYGTKIINSGDDAIDSPCITIDGGAVGERLHHPMIRNIYIQHEGGTSFAISLDETTYNRIEEVYIDCNFLGYGGINTLDVGGASFGSFFTTITNSRISWFTAYGIKFEGAGSVHKVIDCHVNTNQDDAVGIYTNREGTSIVGGQVGLSGENNIGIYFYNTASSIFRGGYVNQVFFENFTATSKCVSIDGNTHAFNDVKLEGLRASLSNNLGIFCNFGRAGFCTLIHSMLSELLGGGTAVAWGENSLNCTVDSGSMYAMVYTVHASAIRAFFRHGPISESNLGNIQTDANITISVDWITEWKTPMLWDGTSWRKTDTSRISTATMSGNETMTAEDGNVWIRDPNGSNRNLVISDADFFPGEEITVINTAAGANSLMFDSAGINQAVAQNQRGIFRFDGTDWYTIFVG